MFDVTVEAYDRFMGRYSRPLAVGLLAAVDARPGQLALDVGCGSGAVTELLVARLGGNHVSAADPSASFVASVANRLPAVDVQNAAIENLPWPDGRFDLVVAQLVVHFLADPVVGLREMARVAAPGATVAANVWDYAGTGGPLGPFWEAAKRVVPGTHGEEELPGTGKGNLLGLFDAADMSGAQESVLTVRVGHSSFEEWWAPYTLGVGPAGALVHSLDGATRERLRQECRRSLGDGPGAIEGRAWTVLWRKPGGTSLRA
jgi:SAM-dependent methyltransferase